MVDAECAESDRRGRGGLPEHERLAKVFAKLQKRGVAAVLSNSATPDTRRLFQAFKCSDVAVRRPINSVASRRGPVSELLVVAKWLR